MEDILENVTLSPKLRIDKDADGNHCKTRPRLLFRAFQLSHGFTARRFLSQEASMIPKPPKFGTPRFLSEVEPHLRIDRTYQSPVLSLTEWVGYAMKIVDENPERSLAVFDFLAIEEDLKFRLGKRCRPYLVPSICKQYGLYDLPNRYTGRGEWLVWANIKCDPVIIFNKGSVLELRQTLSSMCGLNKSTGEKLGKLLRDVKDEFKELLARSLVKSYKVTGCNTNYNRPTWLEFADALYRVNSGNREASVIRTLCGGSSVDGDEEEIDDDADIWNECSEPPGTDRNEPHMMEEALEVLKGQGRDILREAQAAATTTTATSTTTTTTTRGDVTVLEGLHDWVDVAPTPTPLSLSHTIDIPASSPAPSTRARSIIDLTADTAEYNDDDGDSDDDSFFEVEMEITSTPRQQRGEEQEDSADLVIIGSGHYHHQAMPMRSKSQSVVLIRSQQV